MAAPVVKRAGRFPHPGCVVTVSGRPIHCAEPAAPSRRPAGDRNRSTVSSAPAAGISDESNVGQANYGGVGYGYSADALAGVGFTPGATVHAGGLRFTWTSRKACSPTTSWPPGRRCSSAGRRVPTPVPVDPNKTVKSITFPDVSNTTSGGATSMHVWAVSLGTT
ncbi:MAG TPA: hypothetical protein VMJ65_07960 [Solirubrobacteraceae bacterium]|nr:hypothetical protein [Solirubrobacteraceae bacterium]